MLSERAIEVQIGLYLCLMDYSNTFDKIQQKVLLGVLGEVDLHGKDIQIICKLYWEETARVQIANACT